MRDLAKNNQHYWSLSKDISRLLKDFPLYKAMLPSDVYAELSFTNIGSIRNPPSKL